MTLSFTRALQHARSLMLLLFMALGSTAFAQELIPNGSMETTLGASTVPSAAPAIASPIWTKTLTPDINDLTGCWFPTIKVPWQGTPVASPNGGNFAGLVCLKTSSTLAETLSTTVSGLTAGKQYTLTYQWAVTPPNVPSSGPFTGAARPVLTVTGLNGTPTVNTATATQWNWQTVTQTFNATSTSASFTFTIDIPATGNQQAYLGLDGVSFKLACLAGTTAPVPASNTVAVCGPLGNLTPVEPGTKPAGTTFSWHTATPATDGNIVADPTSVGPGTYYLAFHDSGAGCYSPTSTSVTVTNTTPATPTISATNPTCTVSTGGISVSAPVSGATYTLTPGGTTSSTGVFTGLAPNNYTVTATVSGCTSAASSSATVGPVPTGCCEANAGTITLNP